MSRIQLLHRHTSSFHTYSCTQDTSSLRIDSHKHESILFHNKSDSIILVNLHSEKKIETDMHTYLEIVLTGPNTAIAFNAYWVLRFCIGQNLK
jgi:hypothetical protein